MEMIGDTCKESWLQYMGRRHSARAAPDQRALVGHPVQLAQQVAARRGQLAQRVAALQARRARPARRSLGPLVQQVRDLKALHVHFC